MSGSQAGFQKIYLSYKKEWEKNLRPVLKKTSLARSEKKLQEAILYSLQAGGKRLRPVFSLASSEIAGVDAQRALFLGTALEALHTYSLVHDDLPAMDDDDLRRGKPTSHVVYGEAIAILVGDSLHTLAYELLALAEVSCAALGYFARAVGPAGLIGGQFLDMEQTGSVDSGFSAARLKKIHRKKTGALIAASFVLPVLCNNNKKKKALPSVEQVESWAEGVGVLFQIVDDILDCMGSKEELGKSPGKDLQSRKLTYVTLYGLEKSRVMAARLSAQLTSQAHELFSNSVFMTGLPGYILDRTS